MTRLPRLTHAAEYLDEPVQEPAILEASLADVAAVNRWLGGRRALLRRLRQLLRAEKGRHHHQLTILDGGTGSADLPRAIVRWARRRGIPVRIVACDIQDQTLEIARRQSSAFPEIHFTRADVRRLPFAAHSFDLAILSLTLHHLEGDDPVRALRELGRVARGGVIVGELERGWPGYLGARLLAATIWRSNRLTRHDGPLSVLRAFTPPELLALARTAGLAHPRVHRHPLFRLVLCAGPLAE
jgi:SAM-dependent methyltransferase